MKWTLFDFKTAKEPWFEVATELYLKKIKPYAPLDIVRLKTISVDREESVQKKKFEEKALLEKLSSDDFIILLDEKGKKFDSAEFAKQIIKANESNKKRGVLVIGGAFGVTESIQKRAQLIVSLSEMTMNHLVAEVMLLEQFYRAQTIINRIPYHNI
ncbi:MAG: 23S rRNA (pseudouridine(1915)-N(3))-methyltransferase RlmH [Bdellovibrionaceae bacterium]|nr:23S rRNA (pseudouridine(1915)-N(3))-methyltransferase RlmH [Bdellovibrio sp.]